MKSNAAIPLDCDIPYVEASLPLWREALWGLEWLQLRASPVYRGDGVDKGNGGPVVLVPGFLGSDTHLTELQRWVTRVGYRVVPSGDVLLEKLLETVEAAFTMAGRRVRLIGYSLGGSLARAAAVRRSDLIAQVITLASPIREIRAHPLVLGLAKLAGGIIPPPSEVPRRHGDHFHNGTCSCELMDALAQPIPGSIARAAIFSRDDGMVDWQSCQDDISAYNVEVHGSHLGLIVNREVYRVLAELLVSVDDRTLRQAV